MKKTLLLIFLCISFFAKAQTYQFVYGDLHFMVENKNPEIPGQPHDDFIIRTGLPDAAFDIFYDEAQKLVCQKGTMKDGHRIRIWAYYYRNQKLHWEIPYTESGQINGILREYYENGSLKTETEYKLDFPNGLSSTYNQDGKKIYLCTFKEGKLDGKVITYAPDGWATKTEVYANGKLMYSNDSPKPAEK